MHIAGQPLASRIQRLIGALLDCLPTALFGLLFMHQTGILDQTSRGVDLSAGQQVSLFLVAQGAFLLCNAYLLAKRGQTLGKWVARTRIVNEHGQVPGLGVTYGVRTLVIAVVVQVPIIGPIVSFIDTIYIFGSERRCFHDWMANTWVVTA